MRYVSHPIADLMRPKSLPTDLGVIIRVNHKVFWARNTRNPTIADYCEVRVYENVWMQLYIVIILSQIQYEDKLYEHIHVDKTSLLTLNAINRRNPYNKEVLEDENVLFEPAGYYGYD